MQEPIEADAREAIEEAPPERTTLDVSTGEIVPAPPATLPDSTLPIIPERNELAVMAQMAVTFAAADTAPAALRNKPNDVLMVLMTARDVGVGLTTAIREFHVIDGKVTLSPKVKLAMVHSSGHGKVYPHQPPRMVLGPSGDQVRKLCDCGSEQPANDDRRATWHAERADQPGILHSSTFTIEMAQRVHAREGGNKITLDQKSTWRQYPQRMLSWRALGYLLDDVFPEVGTGLYSPDELGAVTDEDGSPIIDVVGQAEPVQGTRSPRGHRAPPPPEAPPADPEKISDLQARIDKLKALPPARDALVALWTATRDDGTPTLPPVTRLRANQIGRAEAMVKSIEDRAAKAEWGPWPPQETQDGPGEGATDETPAAPSEGAEAPTGPVQEVIDAVRAIPNRDALLAALRERDLSTSGNMDTLRHRLAQAMLADVGDGLPAQPEFDVDPEPEPAS